LCRSTSTPNADGNDNGVVQLLGDGLRTITGLISKGSPEAAKVQTGRHRRGGADFDARLCGQDCKAEASKIQATASPDAVLASAELAIVAQGDIYSPG
jgi:hypothetical protein